VSGKVTSSIALLYASIEAIAIFSTMVIERKDGNLIPATNKSPFLVERLGLFGFSNNLPITTNFDQLRRILM